MTLFCANGADDVRKFHIYQGLVLDRFSLNIFSLGQGLPVAVRTWSPATWAVLGGVTRLSGVNKQRLSPIPNGAYSRGIVLLTLVEDLSRGVHW